LDAKDFGKNVLVQRKEKGLNQQELAALADISRNYISMIERGDAKNVSDEIIRKLATSLETSIEELLGAPGGDDSSAIKIPPSLREFALSKGISYKVAEKLLQIPFRGKEPQTPDTWQELYDAVEAFITD